MSQVRLILRRTAQLLEDYPTVGPHMSVELALQRAHRQVTKFWGYLPIAKVAVMDQLRLEGHDVPVEQWLQFTGEKAKRLVPILRNAAHLSREEFDDDWE